ncbi:MAG: ABC transporter ATP-binding protein [Jaaginema sp. PMC 1079.18]|nr:ABC transporter ATP-binding protein [Jaaginema sp. PMC 1080.18]MEC4849895.1 ABC transporter ATP-binding protein [Jaaginema sp. PMC 1079.18]MEC4865992.1 ABC transporter ATP-binding protein [Jaaginema sp. PMC 1078.18]
MASFRHIVSSYKPYRAIALFGIVASGFFEVIDLAVPYSIGQILNILSQQPLDVPVQILTQKVALLTQNVATPKLTLLVLLSIIFAVTVLRAPLQPWLASWYHWAVSLQVRRDQSYQVIQKILTLPLEFYEEHNPGRIARRVSNGLNNQTWTYPDIATQFIPKLIRILGIFIIILFIDWRIAIAFLLSFVFILSLTIKNLRRLIQREKLLDEYMENTESRTSEIITNIKTVKAFATESQELKRQQQRFKRELKVIIDRIHRGYVILETKQRFLVQTCIFLVLVATLIEAFYQRISLGHFITVLTISSMAYAEIEPLSIVAETFARRYATITRFHDFLLLKESQESVTLKPQTQPTYQFTGKIEFANVSFGYNPHRLNLKNINFQVQPYQTVALVGRSGSGKSTLVKLLFRYFDPTTGQILIDGEDIRNLNITGYRQRLAIVHQEVDIFNGTLLANLTYGNPQASWEEVQSACKIARVDEFISEFEQGYQTIVGERGVRLSGGQRQRLGIARALIMNPDVLILDEATSSLDYESERLIQLAMRSIYGTRTLIVIAHRLSTVREADRIIVLDEGQIVESGNHAELLEQGGIYQRLNVLQASGNLLS